MADISVLLPLYLLHGCQLLTKLDTRLEWAAWPVLPNPRQKAQTTLPCLQACAKGKKQRMRGRMKPGLGGRSFFLARGGGSLIPGHHLPPPQAPAQHAGIGGRGEPGPPSASNCISLPRFLSSTRAIKHFCRQQTFPTTFTYHHFRHPHSPKFDDPPATQAIAAASLSKTALQHVFYFNNPASSKWPVERESLQVERAQVERPLLLMDRRSNRATLLVLVCR